MEIIGRRRPNDEQRQRALDKGWRMVSRYEASNGDLEQVQADSAELTSLVMESRRFEVPPHLRNVIRNYQIEVLDCLTRAMQAWFDFYFVLGIGSVYDRLESVGDALSESADRLSAISRDSGTRLWINSPGYDVLATYGSAAGTWGSALAMIANGAKLDQSDLADHGFQRMNGASDIAERVVLVGSLGERGLDLQQSLDRLSSLEPAERVPKRTVEDAKTPWKRALIAAGSKINWTTSGGQSLLNDDPASRSNAAE